jgi:hypothetical protein
VIRDTRIKTDKPLICWSGQLGAILTPSAQLRLKNGRAEETGSIESRDKQIRSMTCQSPRILSCFQALRKQHQTQMRAEKNDGNAVAYYHPSNAESPEPCILCGRASSKRRWSPRQMMVENGIVSGEPVAALRSAQNSHVS